MMPEDTANLALTILLPVLIETAVLEILEAVHSAETMTATEVLQMVAEEQSRKLDLMGRYAALMEEIKGED